MADHRWAGAALRGGAWTVTCSCGWTSGSHPDRERANREHDQHVLAQQR